MIGSVCGVGFTIDSIEEVWTQDCVRTIKITTMTPIDISVGGPHTMIISGNRSSVNCIIEEVTQHTDRRRGIYSMLWEMKMWVIGREMENILPDGHLFCLFKER